MAVLARLKYHCEGYSKLPLGCAKLRALRLALGLLASEELRADGEGGHLYSEEGGSSVSLAGEGAGLEGGL